MKKFTLTLLIAATLTSSVAFAHPCAGGRAARAGKALQKLDLSADQRAQLRSIHEADREKNRALRQEMRTRREQLRSLRQADDPAARKVRADLQQLRDQLRDARKAAHERVLSVLTPDQRSRIDQMWEQRKSR